MISLPQKFKQASAEIFIHQLSSELGETAQSTEAAVEILSVAVAGAFGLKGSSEAATKDLIDYLESNNVHEGILRDLPALLDSGPESESIKAMGADILKYLMGDKTNALIDHLSAASGLKTSSSSTLLKITATIMAAIVMQVRNEASLNLAGLRQWLSEEHNSFLTNSPNTLNTIIQKEVNTVSTPPETTGRTTVDAKEQPLLSRLLPWIVLMIAALGLFYFLDKGSRTPIQEETPTFEDSVRVPDEADTLR